MTRLSAPAPGAVAQVSNLCHWPPPASVSLSRWIRSFKTPFGGTGVGGTGFQPVLKNNDSSAGIGIRPYVGFSFGQPHICPGIDARRGRFQPEVIAGARGDAGVDHVGGNGNCIRVVVMARAECLPCASLGIIGIIYYELPVCVPIKIVVIVAVDICKRAGSLD